MFSSILLSCKHQQTRGYRHRYAGVLRTTPTTVTFQALTAVLRQPYSWVGSIQHQSPLLISNPESQHTEFPQAGGAGEISADPHLPQAKEDVCDVSRIQHSVHFSSLGILKPLPELGQSSRATRLGTATCCHLQNHLPTSLLEWCCQPVRTAVCTDCRGDPMWGGRAASFLLGPTPIHLLRGRSEFPGWEFGSSTEQAELSPCPRLLAVR